MPQAEKKRKEEEEKEEKPSADGKARPCSVSALYLGFGVPYFITCFLKEPL